jgi:hypothetical protein
MRTLLVVFVTLAMLVGCGEPAATEPVGFVILDTMPGTGLGPPPRGGGCGSVAFLDLRLRGDPDRVPAVWVEAVHDGTPLRVVWPPGFRARFEPDLVLYDARGRLVAREGDILTNGGGDPDFADRPMTLSSFNGVDYPCE